MHLTPPFTTPDAPVLPLFIFVSPSSPPFPSIHSFTCSVPLRESLRLSVHSLLLPPILCEGESYGVFEKDSALHWLLYVISFLCLWNTFPSELTPVLSQKVPVCHRLMSIRNEEGPLGELVIKHLPLLMATHFHSNSCLPSPPLSANTVML